MRIPLLAVLLYGVTLTAEAEMFFQGYRTTSEGARFVLSNDQGKVSPWIAVGSTFDGYLVDRFDAAKEILTLKKAGEEKSLALVQGKIAAAKFPPTIDPHRIGITSEGQPDIEVADDPAAIQTLRPEFQRLAAKGPDTGVRLVIGRSVSAEQVNALFRLTQETKLTVFAVRVDRGATPAKISP